MAYATIDGFHGQELWWGAVTSPGSGKTITASFSAGATKGKSESATSLDVQELRSSGGAATVWSVDGTGKVDKARSRPRPPTHAHAVRGRRRLLRLPRGARLGRPRLHAGRRLQDRRAEQPGRLRGRGVRGDHPQGVEQLADLLLLRNAPHRQVTGAGFPKGPRRGRVGA